MSAHATGHVHEPVQTPVDASIFFPSHAKEKEMHAKLPVSDRSSRRRVRVFSQADV